MNISSFEAFLYIVFGSLVLSALSDAGRAILDAIYNAFISVFGFAKFVGAQAKGQSEGESVSIPDEWGFDDDNSASVHIQCHKDGEAETACRVAASECTDSVEMSSGRKIDGKITKCANCEQKLLVHLSHGDAAFLTYESMPDELRTVVTKKARKGQMLFLLGFVLLLIAAYMLVRAITIGGPKLIEYVSELGLDGINYAPGLGWDVGIGLGGWAIGFVGIILLMSNMGALTCLNRGALRTDCSYLIGSDFIGELTGLFTRTVINECRVLDLGTSSYFRHSADIDGKDVSLASQGISDRTIDLLKGFENTDF